MSELSKWIFERSDEFYDFNPSGLSILLFFSTVSHTDELNEGLWIRLSKLRVKLKSALKAILPCTWRFAFILGTTCRCLSYQNEFLRDRMNFTILIRLYPIGFLNCQSHGWAKPSFQWNGGFGIGLHRSYSRFTNLSHFAIWNDTRNEIRYQKGHNFDETKLAVFIKLQIVVIDSSTTLQVLPQFNTVQRMLHCSVW